MEPNEKRLVAPDELSHPAAFPHPSRPATELESTRTQVSRQLPPHRVGSPPLSYLKSCLSNLLSTRPARRIPSRHAYTHMPDKIPTSIAPPRPTSPRLNSTSRHHTLP